MPTILLAYILLGKVLVAFGLITGTFFVITNNKRTRPKSVLCLSMSLLALIAGYTMQFQLIEGYLR